MRFSGDIVVVATKNKGKVKEFAFALDKLGLKVRSMFDYEGLPAIVEDGATFAANALIKAKAVAQALQVPVLADDSGLCVDRLNGEPGIFSARYAGEGADDSANNGKLLHKLNELGLAGAADAPASVRQALPPGVQALSPASFRCALALFDPVSESALQSEGTVHGYIVDQRLGSGGFGYDPLFWLPVFNCSMAQLSTEQKQSISHRGEALSRLIAAINA